MLPQTSEDATTLAKMYNISKSELKYIDTHKAGQGLIRIGTDLIPFENIIPENTELYTLMDTKPSEGVTLKKNYYIKEYATKSR